MRPACRYVADVVLPTLITGMTLDTRRTPVQVDLSDTGTPLAERLRQGGTTRAHARAREMAVKPYREAMERDWHFPPIVGVIDPEQSET